MTSSSLVLTAGRPMPWLMLFRLMTLLLERIAMAGGGAATAAAVGRCCGYSVGGGRNCRIQAGYLGTGLALFTIVRAAAAASTYRRHLAVVGNGGGGSDRAAAAASDRRQRC